VERTSQLILRNRAALDAGELLLINPPADNLFGELAPNGFEISVWCQDFGDYRWFRDRGEKADFGVVPDAGRVPPQVIMFLPREKERLELMLHFLACALPGSGCLWLAGENQSGIRSAVKSLRKYFSDVLKTDTARHSALYRATMATKTPPFRLEDYQQKWTLGDTGTGLRLVSLPGVFAHGRLDRGSGLLLETLDGLKGNDRPQGSVLDFACGIGLIGMSLLLRDPSLELTLLDNSALALESARLSLQASGMQARLLPSDGLTEVNQKFDWIVSNPPFHRGVSLNFDVSRQFFERAPSVLNKHGRIILVCNRHLPYDVWLAERFAGVETVAATHDFKVLMASRPKF